MENSDRFIILVFFKVLWLSLLALIFSRKVKGVFLPPIEAKLQLVKLCLGAVMFWKARRKVLQIPTACKEGIRSESARANLNFLKHVHTLHVHSQLHLSGFGSTYDHTPPPDVAAVLEVHHQSQSVVNYPTTLGPLYRVSCSAKISK
jgi:hypothetical protein